MKKTVGTHIRRSINLQILVAVIVIGGVAAIGYHLISPSHAQSPYVSTYAANGQLSGTTSLVAGGSSPSGNAVQFGTVPSSGSPAYPLKVSSNGRYLVDQNNQPFYYAAATGWIIFSELSTAQAEQYIATIKAEGFNTIQAYMVDWTGSYVNPEGQSAFTNESTLTPNPAYWSNVDTVINYAASLGINMVLGPWELDSMYGQTTLSPSNYQNFAEYLGNRYKNFKNIIWMEGGDHDPINYYGSDSGVDYTPEIEAEAAGFQATDPNHIITYHPHRQTSQWTQLENSSWLAFNMIQFNRAPDNPVEPTPYAYDWVKTDYNITSPIKPTVLAEPAYEPMDADNGTTSPYDVRLSAYWAFLSGAMGIAYGETDTIGSTILSEVNQTGAIDDGYLIKLFESLPWYKLVPDESHTTVTAGYGTDGDSNYVTAERASDGSTVVAYLPVTTTVTVNMTQLEGSVTARWFDPSNGTYITISGSPFTNSGTKTFTPPSSNSSGSPDFVLVLTAS